MRRGTTGLVLLLSLVSIIFCINLIADTIRTSDGKEIRGVVVEEYKDRYVISTSLGEIRVMKSNISSIEFDEQEDNLIRLADKARDARNYTKAREYYEQALKANPRSRAAKDGLAFLSLQVLQKEESKKRSILAMHAEIDQYGAPTAPAAQVKADESTALKQKVDSLTGMFLVADENGPRVAGVEANSPAFDAGIRKGDYLVAIWGRLTGYLSFKEISDLLLHKGSMDVRCTIERVVDIPIATDRNGSCSDLIGLHLEMKFEGLTVTDVKEYCPASRAGLMKGDLLTAINDASTRYMPYEKAIEVIRKTKSDSLKLTFRRDVIIWKKEAL